MKYIKLFEKFTKDYMKKIDLKDFKKIKKGSKILYMGGQVEVLDNNDMSLNLKEKTVEPLLLINLNLITEE